MNNLKKAPFVRPENKENYNSLSNLQNTSDSSSKTHQELIALGKKQFMQAKKLNQQARNKKLSHKNLPILNSVATISKPMRIVTPTEAHEGKSNPLKSKIFKFKPKMELSMDRLSKMRKDNSSDLQESSRMRKTNPGLLKTKYSSIPAKGLKQSLEFDSKLIGRQSINKNSKRLETVKPPVQISQSPSRRSRSKRSIVHYIGGRSINSLATKNPTSPRSNKQVRKISRKSMNIPTSLRHAKDTDSTPAIPIMAHTRQNSMKLSYGNNLPPSGNTHTRYNSMSMSITPKRVVKKSMASESMTKSITVQQLIDPNKTAQQSAIISVRKSGTAHQTVIETEIHSPPNKDAVAYITIHNNTGNNNSGSCRNCGSILDPSETIEYKFQDVEGNISPLQPKRFSFKTERGMKSSVPKQQDSNRSFKTKRRNPDINFNLMSVDFKTKTPSNRKLAQQSSLLTPSNGQRLQDSSVNMPQADSSRRRLVSVTKSIPNRERKRSQSSQRSNIHKMQNVSTIIPIQSRYLQKKRSTTPNLPFHRKSPRSQTPVRKKSVSIGKKIVITGDNGNYSNLKEALQRKIDESKMKEAFKLSEKGSPIEMITPLTTKQAPQVTEFGKTIESEVSRDLTPLPGNNMFTYRSKNSNSKSPFGGQTLLTYTTDTKLQPTEIDLKEPHPNFDESTAQKVANLKLSNTGDLLSMGLQAARVDRTSFIQMTSPGKYSSQLRNSKLAHLNKNEIAEINSQLNFDQEMVPSASKQFLNSRIRTNKIPLLDLSLGKRMIQNELINNHIKNDSDQDKSTVHNIMDSSEKNKNFEIREFSENGDKIPPEMQTVLLENESKYYSSRKQFESFQDQVFINQGEVIEEYSHKHKETRLTYTYLNSETQTQTKMKKQSSGSNKNFLISGITEYNSSDKANSSAERHARAFKQLKSQYDLTEGKENGQIHMSDIDFFVSNPNTEAKEDLLYSQNKHTRSVLYQSPSDVSQSQSEAKSTVGQNNFVKQEKAGREFTPIENSPELGVKFNEVAELILKDDTSNKQKDLPAKNLFKDKNSYSKFDLDDGELQFKKRTSQQNKMDKDQVGGLKYKELRGVSINNGNDKDGRNMNINQNSQRVIKKLVMSQRNSEENIKHQLHNSKTSHDKISFLHEDSFGMRPQAITQPSTELSNNTGVEYGYSHSPREVPFSKSDPNLDTDMVRKSREQIIFDIKQRIQQLDTLQLKMGDQQNQQKLEMENQLPETSDFSNTIETSSIPTPRLTSEDTQGQTFTQSKPGETEESPTEKSDNSNLTLVMRRNQNVNSAQVKGSNIPQEDKIEVQNRQSLHKLREMRKPRNSCSRKLDLDDLENLENFEDLKNIPSLDNQSLTLKHKEELLKTDMQKPKGELEDRTTVNVQKQCHPTATEGSRISNGDRETHQIRSFNPNIALNFDSSIKKSTHATLTQEHTLHLTYNSENGLRLMEDDDEEKKRMRKLIKEMAQCIERLKSKQKKKKLASETKSHNKEVQLIMNEVESLSEEYTKVEIERKSLEFIERNHLGRSAQCPICGSQQGNNSRNSANKKDNEKVLKESRNKESKIFDLETQVLSLQSELEAKNQEISNLQSAIMSGNSEVSSLLKNLDNVTSVLAIDLIQDSKEVSCSLTTTEKKCSRASNHRNLEDTESKCEKANRNSSENSDGLSKQLFSNSQQNIGLDHEAENRQEIAHGVQQFPHLLSNLKHSLNYQFIPFLGKMKESLVSKDSIIKIKHSTLEKQSEVIQAMKKSLSKYKSDSEKQKNQQLLSYGMKIQILEELKIKLLSDDVDREEKEIGEPLQEMDVQNPKIKKIKNQLNESLKPSESKSELKQWILNELVEEVHYAMDQRVLSTINQFNLNQMTQLTDTLTSAQKLNGPGKENNMVHCNRLNNELVKTCSKQSNPINGSALLTSSNHSYQSFSRSNSYANFHAIKAQKIKQKELQTNVMNLLEENNKLSQLLEIAKSSLNNQNLDCKQQIHSLQLENSRLVNLQESLTSEIENHKLRIKELEAKVLDMLRNLEEEKARNSVLLEFEQKYMTLKMTMSKLKFEKEQLFESKSALERLEKTNLHKINTMKEKIAKLEGRFSSSQNENHFLRRSVDTLNHQIMNTSLRESQQSIKLQKEREQLDLEKSRLANEKESEMRKLQEENVFMRTKNKDLEYQIQKLNMKMLFLEANQSLPTSGNLGDYRHLEQDLGSIENADSQRSTVKTRIIGSQPMVGEKTTEKMDSTDYFQQVQHFESPIFNNLQNFSKKFLKNVVINQYDNDLMSHYELSNLRRSIGTSSAKKIRNLPEIELFETKCFEKVPEETDSELKSQQIVFPPENRDSLPMPGPLLESAESPQNQNTQQTATRRLDKEYSDKIKMKEEELQETAEFSLTEEQLKLAHNQENGDVGVGVLDREFLQKLV